MQILDLWGVSVHAVVVFGLGKNLLFKSILGRCVYLQLKDLLVLSDGNEIVNVIFVSLPAA